MTSKNMPADIKSKSIKETKEEINKILEKIEKGGANLESYTNDYDRLLKLNKHIDELFKKLYKKSKKKFINKSDELWGFIWRKKNQIECNFSCRKNL